PQGGAHGRPRARGWPHDARAARPGRRRAGGAGRGRAGRTPAGPPMISRARRRLALLALAALPLAACSDRASGQGRQPARPAALGQAEAAVRQRQAEVQQAEANLARDGAQIDNARVQEKRYRELVDRELIAREQYDQIRTNMATFEATVRADQAAIENARAAA